ncbi:P-loop containing nucleoside triphosphate hydrolase protein [Suillus subalutaceus]|uniref:P-loop containing nucleoside triphosphate hydrolase protein n=1 Tax=Suillus subalutaceus TaxID=48586 RepID=UPI001B875E11|nr:P-loop containing nucleoside triphosphate hydrolase protein [Suillus subalutaceus]KAG1838815.1 P-loop containing nucleoside triphosphate hydrolase protein [Suillus subalutaceus]
MDRTGDKSNAYFDIPCNSKAFSTLLLNVSTFAPHHPQATRDPLEHPREFPKGDTVQPAWTRRLAIAEPIAPAETTAMVDIGIYPDIRYRNEQSHPDLVVSNVSRVLIDFLRFFARIYDLRVGLAAVRAALASNLAGDDLKLKAKDMGCTDALGLHKTEEDARRYFEDVAEHLGVLSGMIEKEFEPTAQELELQLSYGHIAFDLLKCYFECGVKYYILQKDDLAGFTLSDTYQDSTFFGLDGETTRWDGHKYINEKNTFSIPKYDGTVELSKLSCKIMTDDIRAKLIARGNLYRSFSGGFHHKSCMFHPFYVAIGLITSRIVIDERAFNESQGYTCNPYEIITFASRTCVNIVPETRRSLTFLRGEHDQLPAFVNGFELKSKQWKSFHVENIDDIRFDEKTWDHLVVDDDVKSLIRGLVDVTKNVNTSQHLISDVITGKGGGLIALLNGPPGTGKTLTAEAVAKHLQRPLYIVSSPELSTEPSKLESKVSEILKLATAWDAVVLIDEAGLECNALVSVALKVFQYHRGVLFLTTNRIQTFDDAFLSRFSIAIKYPELDASARLTIWQKFFELAGCPLWGSESEEFVDVDGKEPRCYVSLSDLEVLAQKPFNGRTIKNLVRTAQALALSAKEPLSLDHIKVVVRAQEKFLTEFAQIRS